MENVRGGEKRSDSRSEGLRNWGLTGNLICMILEANKLIKVVLLER